MRASSRREFLVAKNSKILRKLKLRDKSCLVDKIYKCQMLPLLISIAAFALEICGKDEF